MKRTHRAALAVAFSGGLFVGCNEERKQECEKFLAALKPLDPPNPAADAVDHAHDALAAVSFHDEPLREYAKNTTTTLLVLSNAIALKSNPDAPDGTDALVKQKLKEARTDRDDVARYCSQ